MKKIYWLAFALLFVGFQACEGPEGPPGIDGMDGKDGEDGEDGLVLLTAVLEAEVDFLEENNYQVGYNLELSPGDNVLIFIAVGLDQEENIVWMPLPQTFFSEAGMVIYNYYFTDKYFAIFVDAAELTPQWTENRYFRVVIVPRQHVQESEAARIDFNDYHALTKWLGIEEEDI